MGDSNSDKCLNCKKDIGGSNYFKLNKCDHMFCTQCLCEHIEEKILLKSARIHCLKTACATIISDTIIRECLSNAQIIQYDELCRPDTMVKCLINGCKYFHVPEREQRNYVCLMCKQPNCLICSNLHSETERCGISPTRITFVSNGATNLREKRRHELLKLNKDNALSWNPKKSKCINCEEFLLPRKGIRIMPCMHNFCRNCLVNSLSGIDTIANLKCLHCDSRIPNRECRELIGDDKVDSLSLQLMNMKFFHCQSPNCLNFWDAGNYEGFHKCTDCGADNCIPCRAVHEGQSCIEYRKSDENLIRIKYETLNVERKVMVCFNCNNKFINNGGCGAVRCNNCTKQICVFTGKSLGPKGCGCRQSSRCHKDCNNGCLPDGNSEQERALLSYFLEN